MIDLLKWFCHFFFCSDCHEPATLNAGRFSPRSDSDLSMSLVFGQRKLSRLQRVDHEPRLLTVELVYIDFDLARF